MLRYSHPTLALILDYWPITVFAPTILLLIATLALVTRWWDRRDEAARASERQPAPPGVAVSWQTGRRGGSSTSGSPPPGRPINGDGSDARAAS